MKLLRYIVLILILWRITPFSISIAGPSAGLMMSMVTFLLLMLYYFLVPKRQILFAFILLGIGYYIIAGLQFDGEPKFFINELVKYMITIVCATELARHTTLNELYVFLVLGSLSIIINAAFFPDNYGRYSGYYLNPNMAGVVCAFAYCLSFGITNKKLKTLGQFVVIFAGILTFSRYFFIIWIFISVAAAVLDRKNAAILGIGVGVIVVVFSLASILQLNSARFSALESLINNDQSSSQTSSLEEDSRLDTWSTYYEMILENPITGNGYKKLTGNAFVPGVHNSYLLTLGEAGIVPFFLMLGIYFHLFFASLKYYNSHPVFIFLIITMMGFLAVAHNYYDNYIVLFVSLWLYVKMIEDKGENLTKQLIQ